MRRLILIALTLLSTWPLFSQEIITARRRTTAAPASLFVQGRICNSTTGTTSTCTYTGSVTANHTLVLVARWDDATAKTVSSVVNSAGGNCVASGTTAWTQITAKVASTQSGANVQGMQSWYCKPASTGTLTVSITSSVAQVFLDMNVSEFNFNPSAIDTSSPGASTGTSTPCASGAGATLTATGDLVVGWCGMWDNTQTWANTGSYIFDSGASSNTTQGLFDYTSAGTTAPSFSFAITTADKWTSMTVAFKP